jgi:hypothetical protein
LIFLSIQERPDSVFKLGTGHGAGTAPQYLSFAEKDQGRYTLYAILSRNLGVSIGIYFDNFQFAAVASGYFFQDGRHHFAGAAPVRIKIHQYGAFVAIDKIGKSFFTHFFAGFEPKRLNPELV